ncbi:MAG: DNA polymerase III subunit beta [Phycisphaerales bacterium]|nr:DNA polymerase III subunit beta [Phycisphaerales bacterium]
MKVICDRSALLNAVNLVAGVVSARSPRPQLGCVKFTARKSGKGSGAGSISLAATDAEISIRLSTANAEIQQEGEILIPADKLRGIVAAEDNEPTLTLETDGEVTHIKGADAHFKVFGFPAADFPPIPDFPGEKERGETFAVSASQLARLIERTAFSTSRENSRYAINGVLLRRAGKKLEMVATDGRRLALARGNAESASGEEPQQCIVPTKALTMLAKLLPGSDDKVRVHITDNQVIFSIPGAGDGPATVLASNLVEGTFPPYEDVIPKDQDKKATFDVAVLGSAVKRAALLTNEESRGVRMSFAGSGKAKTLKVSSRAPEMGEAEINVEMAGYEGGDIDIGFNPQFISDALKVIPGEQVILELKSPNKPGLIRSGNDFVYVVMPVNLS